ncbi:MAG: hypothetical protein P8X70_01090 [Nanoarchaeota archaeon]
MIPLTLLFVILGIIGISFYFVWRKKSKKISVIWLIAGIILILMAIIPWTLLILS